MIILFTFAFKRARLVDALFGRIGAANVRILVALVYVVANKRRRFDIRASVASIALDAFVSAAARTRRTRRIALEANVRAVRILAVLIVFAHLVGETLIYI